MSLYTVTPLRVAGLLLFYAALLVIIRVIKRGFEPEERRTALWIGGLWAVSVFIANDLLFRAGVMSFLPWINNFLHTFVWIGGCLTLLYLGLRDRESLAVQMVVFATLSLIVKYAEQLLLGTWDHDDFFQVFEGNFAYVLGWSLADGLYPPLTLFGLRALAKVVPGLSVR
jgi:ABC-type transport system involved in cytochrome c biogenesis permease subunit